MSVPEAARWLIRRQSRLIVINVEGALKGEGTVSLHDLRVAIRRLRTVFRVFRKPLAVTSAAQIDLALKRLNRRLGPVRDLDVWIGFLTDGAVQKHVADQPRWEEFVRQEIANRKLHQPALRRCLSGRAFAALQSKISRLERVELPRLQAAMPPETVAKLARRAWGKSLRRALRLADLRHTGQPEGMHQLRIALRRARYLGEFFAPVLGEPYDKLTRRIHGAEQALGKIHDTDVGLVPVHHKGPPLPRGLVRCLKQRRAGYRAKLDIKWRRLEEFAGKRGIRRKLDL
jgi:CHAD domain-containing protein